MTHISWTEKTWNPIAGCSLLSAGCTNCYAMRDAHRLAGNPNAKIAAKYGGLTRLSGGRAVWTGKVNLDEAAMLAPLRRRRPTTYFVNSMSDLFHEAVPDAWIDRIFAVMALSPQHRFQVLTKRSARMREYFRESNQWRARIAELLNDIKPSPIWNGNVHQGWQNLHGKPDGLPNVWLGVSVEDQAAADARIPDLLATPAALRFLSCEPLLGPVDLEMLHYDRITNIDALNGRHGVVHPMQGECAKIDWVIVGGESGARARPMHPDWARAIRDQCAAAGVPFHFKQWGEFAPGEVAGDFLDPDKRARGLSLFDNQWSECWSEVDGHCDDEPDVYRIGKAKAGRMLDGVLHDAVPSPALAD